MDSSEWAENLKRLRFLIAQIRGDGKVAGEEIVQAFLADLSRKAGRSFPPAIRDDLVPDAIRSLLLEKISRFREEGGSFASWCFAVVRNHGISLQRRLHRDAMGRVALKPGPAYEDPDPLSNVPAASQDPDRGLGAGSEELYVEFERIRQTLDAVSWKPEGHARVNHYAVFLLYLRMILDARLRKWASEWEGFPFPRPSAFIDDCLPWRPSESRLRFRPDDPSLDEIWVGLAGCIDRSEARAAPDLVDELIAVIEARGSHSLTTDGWHQWTKRARDKVKARAGSEAWQRSFLNWFPNRRSDVNAAGMEEARR